MFDKDWIDARLASTGSTVTVFILKDSENKFLWNSVSEPPRRRFLDYLGLLRGRGWNSWYVDRQGNQIEKA